MNEYTLYDYTRGEEGRKVILIRDHLRGAARTAAEIVAGWRLVDGEFVSRVLLTGPGIIDRLYDYQWRDDTFKYRLRCPGMNGNPCESSQPWAHPTSKRGKRRVCQFCWSPSPEDRQATAERNRRLNPILRPRSRKSKELFF